MITLFIDTSTNTLLVALFKDSNLLEETKIKNNLEHSKNAIVEIDKLFKNNNLLPNELSKILVINGPGSFTGIRIGVTISKIYAWALNIEVVPISTLKAYAISNNNHNYYVPIINARRDYVYTGIYDKDYNTYMEDVYISKEELLERITSLDDVVIIGNTSLGDKEIIENEIDVKKVFNYYKNVHGINAHSLNPIYLKKTEAEEKIGEV